MNSDGHPGFRPKLKGLDSVDLPALGDEPEDSSNCRIETTARVGPADDDSGDDFVVFFVTPAWLAENTGPEASQALLYHVVVPKFTWEAAERAATALITSVRSRSWEEFVEEFSRYAHWEFSPHSYD